jgi:predicted metal-dependent hydrolase
VVLPHCSVFSTELLQKPKKKRDSVIVHELLHLRYQNHGKMFHMMLLRSYLGEGNSKS